MALAQLTIIPIGSGTSLGSFVAKIQQQMENEGLSFAINDMSTVIAGELKEILEISLRLHEIPFENGALRVITTISIDDRRDKVVELGDKVDSLTNRKRIGDHEKKQ